MNTGVLDSYPLRFFMIVTLAITLPITSHAQFLQEELAGESPETLAKLAKELGDAKRGAIVFYQPYLACTKCHTSEYSERQLGPELTKPDKSATDTHLVESILNPSKAIRKGFETISVVTNDGKSLVGLFAEENDQVLVLRDPARSGNLFRVMKKEIDERSDKAPSIMPQGLVNQLASRQQFLDLIHYLMEIRDGGPTRALELKPAPSLYAARPLPEYEKDIDHSGMIADLNRDSFKRGEAIYSRLCINCHGTHDKPGSLPTSLRFASGQFKNGNDPFTMYQTLTKGFGMMVPQTWMVPEQKYDVIHYIREAYLKANNSKQYFPIGQAYLDRLPKGSSRGPKPSNIVPWEQMDYGPNLVATYEIGSDGKNFAYKGNAIRLDSGPGGVSRGRFWMIFDYDTLRVAAAWDGKGFVDWNGINFNGRHGIHPRIVGQVHFANPTGPGWANPTNGSFEDNQRVRGRDDRMYGPLPKPWAKYRGMYYHGNKTIVSYTVGDTDVLELPGLETESAFPVFKRTFNIGSRSKDLILQVARQPKGTISRYDLASTGRGAIGKVVTFGTQPSADSDKAVATKIVDFNGAIHINVTKPQDFDLRDSDFSVYARVKTTSGGTIFCKTSTEPKWVPNGKTLFIRGGKLAFDIGWVGVVQSRRRVNDGRWHDVAMTYEKKDGQVRLYIDGKLDGQARLKAKEPVEGHVVRIGYTSKDFPDDGRSFEGDISEVRFYSRALSETEIGQAREDKSDHQLNGHWLFDNVKGELVVDKSGKDHHGEVVYGSVTESNDIKDTLVAGLAGKIDGAEWLSSDEGDLRLRIPAGRASLKFTLWLARVEETAEVEPLVSSLVLDQASADLRPLLSGGLQRWPDVIKTEPVIGNDDGPFAVDVLTHPAVNPWFCRMRLTGFDFYPDGNRMAVSDWDGNIWLVNGLSNLNASNKPELSWRRIASGLFQPLGVKIVDNKIHITCRDQLCVLHDKNGDGEIDYYECLNNDHQVTDHFHEFAMGLQTDNEGNFYYAKSARHALTALVPHHGTLLRVSKDGARTDILATGFRAANGVCINPDGTFIVTDQEGHWNPKNRINWVKPGGFYGNMFGYHDITDTSDDAMDQPLCWITNAFDRSPSELLWCDSKKWGPLNGSLLNFSYGYGKIYVVPHEEVNGQKQGGLCELPIPQMPTGVMRGRFHPVDGQLYTCGMFAWAGSQHQSGGLYRVRYTGKPVHLPMGLKATKDGVSISFSGTLDNDVVSTVDHYAVKVWSLKRTANYGSKHFDERRLKVTAASLSSDGKTLMLTIPEIKPTWCMEIKYSIKSAEGKTINGTIHNTIHNLN